MYHHHSVPIFHQVVRYPVYMPVRVVHHPVNITVHHQPQPQCYTSYCTSNTCCDTVYDNSCHHVSENCLATPVVRSSGCYNYAASDCHPPTYLSQPSCAPMTSVVYEF